LVFIESIRGKMNMFSRLAIIFMVLCGSVTVANEPASYEINNGEVMTSQKDFEGLLEEIIPPIAKKYEQLSKLYWITETTGAKDAADLVAELEVEFRQLMSDANTYKKLVELQKSGDVTDPILSRQLDVLVAGFKQNMIPKELMEKMAVKEAQITHTYTTFRAKLDGKELTENDVIDLLKNETDYHKRLKVWESSKDIGQMLAPLILEVVEMRNEAAKILGYNDFFQMQLDMQEIDQAWLMKTFDEVEALSDEAYHNTIDEIEETLSKRYSVTKEMLGPWAWTDPFGQGDPIESLAIDDLVKDKDMVAATKKFYEAMGFDIKSMMDKSDLFEKEGKNQHAFCINIDRKDDVRTLLNIKQTLRWNEVLLHEFGHAVYERGFDKSLPWLLRDNPHLLTTEAMALMSGRQAYAADYFRDFIGDIDDEKELMLKRVELSSARRQLIFSRWAIVMTKFEMELYSNPHQDLNNLWWDLVEQYQLIKKPTGRDGKNDWASKYHLGLAPVYYYSYLLGEMFASSMLKKLKEVTNNNKYWNKMSGQYLRDKLFFPANKWKWDRVVENVLDYPLTCDDWINDFAK
jgi:peptidyl-dipeptidase A